MSPSATARRQPRFRLVTFNIAHGRGLSLYQGFNTSGRIRRNLRRIAAYLSERRVDVAALQEVDEDSHWNANLALLELIRHDAPQFSHALMGVNTVRGGARPLRYGNAILSRLPVHGWENTPFGKATLGEKGFLYADVAFGPFVAGLVNVHLDFLSRKRRLSQIERVLDYLHEKAAGEQDRGRLPPIVCGDFNCHDAADRDAVRHLFSHILAFGEYEILPRGLRTFPAHWPRRAIDFVFLPRPLEAVRCEVARTFLSDHRPVLVEFTSPVGL